MSDLPIKASDIAKATNTDTILQSVKYQTRQDHRPSDTLTPHFRRRQEISVQNGCLLWGMRVIIPKKYQPQLLELLHETHLGKVKMKMLARSHFWWPNLDENIEEVSNNCKECLEVSKDPTKVPLHQWQYPHRPWQRLYIDYAGPFLDLMWLIVVDAAMNTAADILSARRSAPRCSGS